MPRKRKANIGSDADESPTTSRKRSAPKRPKCEPEEEKRLARYKPCCPQNITERVHRVMTQRFYMIERHKVDGQLKEEFKVLGSTGNVYTVIIDKLPSCDCPDAKKGNHCKHILFIFLKVLSVSLESTFYYQKALLSSELQTIFANAPIAPNSLMNNHVRVAYARATGGEKEGEEIESKAKETEQDQRRVPQEGDDCPICYEDMHEADIKTLTFCVECGNALHNECFTQWAKTKQPVTCVYCRATWTATGVGAAGTSKGTSGGTHTQEGYLNLGSAAGLSPIRDTSTYHSGPRRGQRWRSSYYY